MNIYFVAVLVATASFTGHENLQAQNEKKLYTAPLGVEAYTFRKSFPIDVSKTLDTVQSMGFTEIEGASNNVSAETFKKLCTQRGISIPSVGDSYEHLEKWPDSAAY